MGLERPPGLARRSLPPLAVVTVVVTYAQIVLGGVVRVSGSGLGCPDWPLCHGHLLPPFQLHAIIEYSHRTVGFAASCLIVLTAALAWFAVRHWRSLKLAAGMALALLVVQVLLGGVTVLLELPPQVVLVHLATAMLLLGATVVTAMIAVRGPRLMPPLGSVKPSAVAALIATFCLLLSGSLVVATGASAACAGWPLCDGTRLLFSGLSGIQLVHRGLALLAGLALIAALARTLRDFRNSRAARLTVALTAAALALQVAVGAAIVLLRLPPLLRGLHLALATAVWTGTVTLAAISYSLPSGLISAGFEGAPRREESRTPREVVLDYLSLAKPRIIVLLLVTTLGAMMIAARGWPSTGLVALTLTGGALAAGGAGALNCWIDRDLDRAMLRTRRRPIPDGRIEPVHALLFGIGLGVAAFALLAFGVNVLAATLAAVGLLFYVLVYTLWLKRATSQNIVIGGAAGAVPPLVGWAAVTHGLDLTALSLFAIIFFWTPPHFWSLALRLKGDYARARVPMLPVVKGEMAAKRQIVVYTLIVLALTLALFIGRALGLVYLAGAAALGAVFVVLAVLNLLDHRNRWLRPLFDYSIAYLAMLFAIMVIDRMVNA